MEIQFRMSKVYKKKLGYSCVKIKTGKPDSKPQLPSGGKTSGINSFKNMQ